MVTIAIIGKYTPDELMYALCSVLEQRDAEWELLISLEEVDVPVCETVSVINSYSKGNRILFNLKKCDDISCKSDWEYIKRTMRGEHLVCLRDGEALLEVDTLSKYLGMDDKFAIGGIAFFNDKNEYIDYFPNYREIGPGQVLDKIRNEKCRCFWMMPRKFVKSEEFNGIEIHGLEDAIFRYVERNDEKIEVRNQLSLKYNLVHREDSYVDSFLEEKLWIWEQELEQNRIRLNYSSYIELIRLLTRVKAGESKETISREIDERIQYIVKKQCGGVWDIATGKKAFIVYAIRLLSIIWGDDVNSELEYFKNNLEYEDKIKVLFIISEHFLWLSCYKSIYDALIKEKYHVNVLYVPFKHNEIYIDQEKQREEWQKSGISICEVPDYELDKESPDVVFYCKPYDFPYAQWNIGYVEKIQEKIIYVPYNMSIMDTSIKQLTYCLPMHVLAWRQLVYSKQHEKLINENAYNLENKLCIGHPKFDISICDLDINEVTKFDAIKKSAGGRKIYLWNSSYLMDTQRGETGTFLKYGIEFLEYLKSAKDIFVVWRPHPVFVEVIKKYECSEYVHQLIEEAEKNETIFFDTNGSQWPALLAADVLISDPSSLIEGFAPTEKPIILTALNLDETVVDGIVYKVCDFESLRNTVIAIVEGNDYMCDLRKKNVRENYYLPQNESVGEKVAKFIVESFAS